MAKRLLKFITKEEMAKILKAEKDKPTKLAYLLAFSCGLRLSEIVGPSDNSNQNIRPIEPSQINLTTKQVKVFGKGSKERITTINPLFPITESMLKYLPLHINRRTLQYRFNKASKKLLGKTMNFHSLRHGFGNFMANERQLPLTMLQGLMGHTNINQTAQYAQANPAFVVQEVWRDFE